MNDSHFKYLGNYRPDFANEKFLEHGIDLKDCYVADTSTMRDLVLFVRRYLAADPRRTEKVDLLLYALTRTFVTGDSGAFNKEVEYLRIMEGREDDRGIGYSLVGYNSFDRNNVYTCSLVQNPTNNRSSNRSAISFLKYSVSDTFHVFTCSTGIRSINRVKFPILDLSALVRAVLFHATEISIDKALTNPGFLKENIKDLVPVEKDTIDNMPIDNFAEDFYSPFIASGLYNAWCMDIYGEIEELPDIHEKYQEVWASSLSIETMKMLPSLW